MGRKDKFEYPIYFQINSLESDKSSFLIFMSALSNIPFFDTFLHLSEWVGWSVHPSVRPSVRSFVRPVLMKKINVIMFLEAIELSSSL